ncbi:TPA: hypothetical protein I4D46_08705 [Enterobacter hormaechei]|uniref:DUF6056 family protein n=2 Tax=Enterobacter hormaechei TaxID=158836 RepID=UPI000799CF0E|nr:DUF6056 family protein [Enterobacter hormaechei]HCJ7344718.1 hypothetical protein [Enterobacter hormaechei subsp. xiangfangensis]EKS6393996.1 hypothetical protein [Enterobacter hormaechei]MBK4403910.1 hypothetical protein [Enterobacter hormaechei]SAA43682.1 Uncharacterised protein [Enterobacter hormaechei]SAA72308.1 Uncharacterised protein [Enterobacter hormaechei]
MRQNTLVNNATNIVVYVAIAIVLYKLGSSLGLRTYMDDDVYFVNALAKMSLGEFLNMRYMTWSGRIIIEAIMVKTINIHYTWRVMIPCCLLLLCHSVYKLSSGKDGFSPKCVLLIMLLFFCMPTKTYTEGALWVTGFYNYLLPVSFGLYSISVLNAYQQASGMQKSLSILALPIACSNEQMGVTMIAFIVYSFMITRSIDIYRITFSVLSLASFALLMLAPGNKLRFIGESRRIPEFADFSMLDKIGMGLDRFSSLVNSQNLLMMFTSIMLVILYYKLYKGRFQIFGVAASCFVIIFNIAKEVHIIPSQFMSPGDWVNISFYFRYMLSLLFYVTFIYLSLLIFNEQNKHAIIFMVVFAPATVLMIGFSPTVYASADRVLFMFEAMLLTISFSTIRKLI